jgi:hypothetical protein
MDAETLNPDTIVAHGADTGSPVSTSSAVYLASGPSSFVTRKGLPPTMFQKIKESLHTTFKEETFAERKRRMIPAALFSILASSVYVLVFSSINVILYPHLHLAFDWGRFLGFLFGLGAGLGLAGAIVGWFTEDHLGVVGGGIVMTVLVLLISLIGSLVEGRGSTETMQALVISLPLIAPAILFSLAIRAAVRRHLRNLHEAPERRRKLAINLISIVLLVGIIPGLASMYDLSRRQILQAMNEVLQMDVDDPELGERFPFAQIPGWKDHYDMEYELYPRSSAVRAGSLDVTIRYEDGFRVTCLVDSGSAGQKYFTYCSLGAQYRQP